MTGLLCIRFGKIFDGLFFWCCRKDQNYVHLIIGFNILLNVLFGTGIGCLAGILGQETDRDSIPLDVSSSITKSN